jgi:hypothetical protein
MNKFNSLYFLNIFVLRAACVKKFDNIHIHTLYMDEYFYSYLREVGNVVPIHCMSYKVSGGRASVILNLSTRWRWVVSLWPWLFYPYGRSLHFAGWAPEPVWTFWRRGKSPASAGNGTLYCPAHSLVAISTSYCTSPYFSRSIMLCTHKMRIKTQSWLANVTQKMVAGAEVMVALYTWVYRTPESRGTALSAAARIANTFPVWTNKSQWNHSWL